MSKEMIISVNGREKKIAIIEDDVVTEFYVERGDENQGIVGNIYKGRVMKVLPGMQSAFVDIGLERDSFLYVSDFFDEDLEDDEDEKKESIRQQTPPKAERQRPPITRPSRKVEPVVEESEDDQELDLAVAALRHIEEISEEPVIEPEPDEDAIDGLTLVLDDEAVEEKPEPRSSRQRRKSRLRYPESEITPEEAAGVQPIQIEEDVAESVEESLDTDETSSRRGRGRGRGRGKGRGRGDSAETTDIDETVKAVKSSGPRLQVESDYQKPFILVHHEPFERVTDEDLETAGDMLKDAMMQERISGKIHEDERRTSIIEVEPTPEIHVGALQHSFGQEAGFERVSDKEEHSDLAEVAEISAEKISFASDPAETEADITETLIDLEPEAPQEFLPAPIEEVEQPVDEQSLTHHVVEIGDDVEMLHLNPPAVEFGETLPVIESVEPLEIEDFGEITVVEAEESESESEEIADPELKDASGRIRQRNRRGEMATRRGGRGRRRSYRQRQSATDATTEAEDHTDAGDEEDSVTAAPINSPGPILRTTDRFQRPVISDLLREGQEIIVQIAKEPIGQKGARITSHVAMPGRYIVYMPTVEHIGVSRKIGTDEERQRLRRTLHQLRAEAGAPGGFIVRTAANGCTMEELREDMQYLIRTWTDIRRRSERAKSPAIVHRDLDLVQRILRDQLSQDYTAIRVDNEFEYERIVDFVNRFAPKLVHRVKLYTKDTPILENYGVQPEIDKAVKPRVWLKSGGYIVINQTEALVAIDVNTGKFVGKSNRLEDTITKTNLEAAKEIVRQIRLRDLGGIIVLDFIDMEERRNRQKVMQALEQELRSDRSPSKILQFNDFGLVAVTRKRVKQSLERTLCAPCSYCGGGGMVKSSQTICYEILAEARRISKDVEDHNEVILRVNPEVAKSLRGVERDVLNEIEAYLGGVVTIKSDPTIHQEQFDIALA